MLIKKGKRKSRLRQEDIKDIRELKQTIKRDAKEFASLYEIGKSLTSTLDLKKVLDLITRRVAEVMKADICTLRLLVGKNRLILRSAWGLDVTALNLKRAIKVGEGIVGRVVNNMKPMIVKDVRKNKMYANELFAYQKELRSLVAAPLVEMDRVVGIFSIYSKRENFYKEEDGDILALFASQAAIAIENARLFEKTQSNYMNTMKFLAGIIDAKDSYTADHSERVMKYVLTVADKLGLSGRQKEILRYASLLHDIGKIAIDTSILSKPGPLTEEEWKQIIKHPIVGSKIIKKVGFLNDLIPVILYHHERYNGTGYPHDGSFMKGDGIPIEARILAVVDAYEAMTSDRPYRKALSRGEAISELKKNSGSQFDPKIVSVFLNILEKFK